MPTNDEDNNRIVYVVVSEGGGMDGRDPSDKGGVVVHATFSKREAEAAKAGRVEARIVDMVAAKREVVSRLDALSLFVLGLDQHGNPFKPVIVFRGD